MSSWNEAGEAIRNKDARELRRLLEADPDLRRTLNDPLPEGAFGGTALLAAVDTGSQEIVDILLDAGADPNRRSDWWAGSFGVLDSASPAMAAHLMSRGATLTANAAARFGMAEELDRMITADPELVHARGGDGQTPLHVASTVAVAGLLLARGAAIDARDIDHESTPAQYLCGEHPDVARYLVSRGCHTDLLLAAALDDLALARTILDANPEEIRIAVSERWFPKQNPHSGGTIYTWSLGAHATPHAVAHQRGFAEMFRFLMERSPASVRLARACELNDARTVQQLLAESPTLAQTLAPDDQRALPNAAQKGNLPSVQLMLQAGWPVDALGQHGATALHWAAWHGDLPTVKELLAYHPNLELRNPDWNSTPLQWALHGSLNSWHRETGDYQGVVEALLAAGAQPVAITPELRASEPALAALRKHVR